MNRENYDVFIIGGGIVGTFIARELSKYSVKTCLIEKEAEVSFGVSKANSGIIHAGIHADADSLRGQLCEKGNILYSQLKDELDIPFQRTGELVVIKDEVQFPDLERLMARGKNLGVAGLRIMDRAETLRMEPNLSASIQGALLAPTAGVVNPYELIYILVSNAQKNGVRFRTDEEVIAIDGDHVITTKGQYTCRFIVNAAGLYADRIARMVGLDHFKIHPRKGQEYLLDKKMRGIVNHIIFPVPTPTSKGMLIIPTLDGTIMVGPSAEETDDREDRRTTDQMCEAIFAHVKSLVPALDARKLIAAFAGVRPVATGEDFIIEPTRVKGFINVAGIQSPGLTAAPAIAAKVVQILKDAGLEPDKKFHFVPHNYKIHKVRESNEEQLRKLIEIDPEYGAIVCRCEMVSAAEIRRAAQNGARTLDGVKFRTRAGMGRCQGGFCTFKTLEIIADELKISPMKVTKKGAGSEILLKNIGNDDE